jgi:hypothetical protein
VAATLLLPGALQSVRSQPLGPPRYRQRPVLSWNWLPVQSSMTTAYCRILVLGSHFAVGPILGLVVFRSRHRPELRKPLVRCLSSGSAFLQSLTRLILADASASAPLLGSASLQHMQDSRVHGSRACHTRYGPPSGFDYPPDGLPPSNPGRPCFMPTALVGFVTPFGAFPSRKVLEVCSPPSEPACRWPTVTSKPVETGWPVRPTSTSGLPPFRESLAEPQRVPPRLGRMLPWACPLLGPATDRLEPDSHPASSRALGVTVVALTTATLHLRVSISDRLVRSRTPGKPDTRDQTTLLGFLRHASPDR